MATMSNAIRSRGHSLEGALPEAGGAGNFFGQGVAGDNAITVALSKQATNTSRRRVP
jgi:hypothetical protein